MNVLVVYDSYFGNTEKIAQTVGSAFEPAENVRLTKVSEVTPDALKDVQVLVVGSPTRAFSPSDHTKKFLKSLPAGSLKGVRAAAFDTRINPEDTNSGLLKFLVKIFGYAAQPISNQLKKAGAEIAAQPEGFFVKDTEGPLKDGELERAAGWAKHIRLN